MPNYRRSYVPGGSYFFTVVTERRAKILCTDTARSLLKRSFRRCQQRWAFDIVAIVLLPDHLHTLWVLPPGDDRYSLRWSWIKGEFTRDWLAAGGNKQTRSLSKRRRRERGVWQRRFWEHTIRHEEDFGRHFDYIHYNPVKHGLVACAKDYPFSTFHRYRRSGVYPSGWGCEARAPLCFSDIAGSVGE